MTVKKKPKRTIIRLPAAFVEGRGYCAELVTLSDYENLEFFHEQYRCEHAALVTEVRRLPNAKEIFAKAHETAILLGLIE